MDNHPLYCTLAILNGKIWTAEKSNPFAEAVAISNQTIMKVGSNQEVEKLITPSTKIIDAKKKFITPGFIDSHIHFLMGGERLCSVKLKHCLTIEAFLKTLEGYAKTLSNGEWITGGDWDHINWGGLLPDRHLIDKVTPTNPVWIGRHEGHMYLANSLALELAGLLKKNLPDVTGGSILLDSEGFPNGLFKDNAIQLVFEKIAPNNFDDKTKFILASMDYVASHGVTSVHHMTEPPGRNRGALPNDLEFFEYFESKFGDKLKTRFYVAVPIHRSKVLQDREKQFPVNKMIKYGAVKGYIDGSLGSHSAAFFEDFCDTPGYRGDTVENEDELLEMILAADSMNLQIFIHAIGDRGINIVLNMFEKVVAKNGKKDRRWRIEHSQHIDLKDIPRYKELGVIASVQPYHAIEDGRFVESYIGKKRLHGTYAFKSFLKGGVTLAFGSDWFVAPPEPLLTIDAAVNRKVGEDCFCPEEKVTVEEALYACTIDAAYSGFEDGIKGSIKEGKLADFVVLSKNLLEIPPENIKDTVIEMTILGGQIIYEKK